jgi:aminoglycoside phosphotransferase (APT) family kinase protein
MSVQEVATQFPELDPVSGEYLGEGCDSTALLVNDTWVFRFPKSEQVEQQLAMEALLLPALADRLPLPVPRFRYYGQPGEFFPRRFVGYPKLDGLPAIGFEAGTIGAVERARLGLFLARLHETDLHVATRCGVPVEPLEESLDELRREALDGLVHAAPLAPDAPLERWRRFLDAPPDVAPNDTFVLTHSDLAAEHILIDPETGCITGIIDWSDAAVSRPEVDVAGLFHWGGESLALEVLQTYASVRGPLAAERLQLARYLGACRGALDVSFGTETRRPEYVTAGLRALSLCTVGHR